VHIQKILVYDDGCRMEAFIKNAKTKTDRLAKLAGMQCAVDRLHIKGHVKECQVKYHPKLFPILTNKNNIVCEQLNYWLGKFKYMCKHMSSYRYNFFLFIMCDMWNFVKLDGRINLVDTFKLEKVKTTFKRKYDDESIPLI